MALFVPTHKEVSESSNVSRFGATNQAMMLFGLSVGLKFDPTCFFTFLRDSDDLLWDQNRNCDIRF